MSYRRSWREGEGAFPFVPVNELTRGADAFDRCEAQSIQRKQVGRVLRVKKYFQCCELVGIDRNLRAVVGGVETEVCPGVPQATRAKREEAKGDDEKD